MRPALTGPPKASPGDRVAVISPSFAAPGAFPQLHERAMQRLRDEFRLVPVEFPTTREVGASPGCSGTRSDGRVRPHLDPAVFLANPKPYLGDSDNTNLLNWLWDSAS